jgi:phage-related protein
MAKPYFAVAEMMRGESGAWPLATGSLLSASEISTAPLHAIMNSANSSSGEKQQDPQQSSDEVYEEEHVHTVYNSIASHFSSTRHKVVNIRRTIGTLTRAR